MNICEIAFSTDWFLTIPGILITCGVILLIIALIMLLVSSSKGKKNASNSQQMTVEAANVVNPSAPAGMGVGITPVPDMDLNSANLNADMSSALNMEVPTITPTVEDALNSVAPTLESMNSVSLENSTSENGFASIPTLEPVAEMEIPASVSSVEMQPVITLKEDEEESGTPTLGSLGSIPNIEEESAKPAEVVEEASIPSVSQTENMNAFDALSSNENTNAYGGTPVIPELKPVQEEEPRPIYGGANPLEATQSIPVVEENHEPYGGALNTADNSVVVETPVLKENDTTEVVSDTISTPIDGSDLTGNVAVLDTSVQDENVLEPIVPEVPTVNETESAVDPIVDVAESVEPTKTFIPKIDDPSVEVEEL